MKTIQVLEETWQAARNTNVLPLINCGLCRSHLFTCLGNERMPMCMHTSLTCTPTNGYKTQMTSSNMATVCRHKLHSLGSQKESIFIEGGQIQDHAICKIHQQCVWSSKRPREHPSDQPIKYQKWH